MRMRIVVMALAIVLNLPGIARAEAEKLATPEKPKVEAKADDKVQTEQIAQLIKDLDADDVKTREKASESLKKIGKPALKALEEASESDNPEVAWRAKTIINAIKKSELKKEREEAIKSNKQQDKKSFSQSFSLNMNSMPGNRSVSVVQDGSGKITVTVTEVKDGKQVTNTYTADSPEQFMAKYPEIAKEYGINIGKNIEIPEIDMGELWDDFGKSWSRRWDDFEKEMDKMRRMMRDSMKDTWIPWGNPPEEETAPQQDKIPAKPEKEAITTLDIGAEIEFIEPPLRAQLNLEDKGGVMVAKIKADGLADKIGLKQYDVVLSINGTGIITVWEFRRLLKSSMESGGVKLEIIRQGKKQMLDWQKK
ncbi:MAG: PDZ domain-containing protein [Candidatus Brocadiia bacterium]